MRHILIFLILVISLWEVSCSQENFLINPNRNFTKKEILQLEYIVSEFDQILMGKYDTESPEKAYLEYSDSAKKQLMRNSSIPYIKNIDSLFIKISKYKIYDQIWISDTLDNNKVYININPDGKYVAFLKEIAKKNEFINRYYRKNKMLGDISPSMVTNFASFIRKINLKDPKYRLIFAIHYITLFAGHDN